MHREFLSTFSSKAIAAFEEGEWLLSAASVWEIVTKYQIGRLELPSAPGEFLPDHMERNAIALLPILPRHVFRLERDPQIAAYSAPTIW